MVPEPRVIKSKNGRNIILRSVEHEDAAALLDYIKITAGETEYLMREPDEVINDISVEEMFIDNIIEAPEACMIIAEEYGVLIGNCAVNPVGLTRRAKHRCVIGVALYERNCNQGIGRGLVEYALEIAESLGYEQAELDVVTANEAAINLYKKLGFETCGQIPNAAKYKDGHYDDVYRMYKRLKE